MRTSAFIIWDHSILSRLPPWFKKLTPKSTGIHQRVDGHFYFNSIIATLAMPAGGCTTFWQAVFCARTMPSGREVLRN